MEVKGGEMGLVRSFRDLEVYKLGRVQAQKNFAITRLFPKEERYSLTDQIRRSSRAVTAMIAESWAKRRYPAAFISKLHEALGEPWKRKLGWITLWMLTTSTNRFTANWMASGSTLVRCSIA